MIAKDSKAQPGDLSVEIVDAGGDAPTEDMFKILVKERGQVVEEFDRATLGRGKQNVVDDGQPGLRDASRSRTSASVAGHQRQARQG